MSAFPRRSFSRALVLTLCSALAGGRTRSALAAKRNRKAKPGASRTEVTFTGYQSLPGGRGMVFVELSELVAVEVHRAGQVVEYRMIGARVPLRNNRNPLNLRDFSSSALSAVLVPEKNAVKLVVTLRGNVQPTHKITPRGKGAVLEVELPPLSNQ